MAGRPSRASSQAVRYYRCRIEEYEPRAAPSDVLAVLLAGALLEQLTPPHPA
jgi:hypothetical protein